MIFSEDDAIFCKDSIQYYKKYMEGQIPNDNIQCLGISSQSNHFYCNDLNTFSNVNNSIEVNSSYIDKYNKIKLDIIDSKLLNKYEKVYWAPNKQFGMFKDNWEKIKYFRTCDYNNNIKSRTVAPDTATGEFVKENNYYFYYSIVPRTNDIGLFNELGCTTLYFNGQAPIETIKYITSDNLNDDICNDVIYNDVICNDVIYNNYELIENIPFTTII